MEIEPSLAGFVRYVWARAATWEGAQQALWMAWVALGALWRWAWALLGLWALYLDRLIAYFCTDYLRLNVTALQ